MVHDGLTTLGMLSKAQILDRRNALLFWGPNIVATEGEQWRECRRIVTPEINNETYAFVWEASRKLYAETVSAGGWSSKEVIEVPNIQALTFKTPWQERKVTDGFRVLVMLTTRCAHLCNPKSARREDMRKGGEKRAARDIFSLLVRVSEEGGNMGLDDTEMIGNLFSFIPGGHGTTTHTSSAASGPRPLNANLQDEIVAQVQDVTRQSDNGILLLEDYGKLDKVPRRAAFYGGTRLFRVFLIREAKQDTALNVSNGEEPRMLLVKKGTHHAN
ncbi:hypothetical protein BU15DRAFT_59856 [Melanogaster broomeanus]|nr:hypothetical protein BU15DRAFT_59856 [Melanogaster broomeanus]